MFKYSTDPDLVKAGYDISSFKPGAVFNDEQHTNACVTLFKQLTDCELIYHNHFDLIEKGKWTRDAIITGLIRKDRIYFIKNREGKFIGMAAIGPTEFENTIRLTGVVIDKKFRGRGLGKHLIKHIMNDNAGKMIQLTVNAANPNGFNLYKSLGFKITDYRMVLKQ